MAGGDLPISGLGPKGDGIHDSSRGRIYVDRAMPGDMVQAKIHRGDDGNLRGDLVSIVKASPDRQKAPCPNYDICGGCTVQHLKDDFYKAWKQEIVRDALRKKGLNPKQWKESVFLPAGTRRRATFAVLKQRNALTMGYYRRRSHQINDIETCLIADPAIMAFRKQLGPILMPVLQDKKPTDVFVQMVGGLFDVVITGPVGRKGRPDLHVREAFAAMLEKMPVARISWRAKERDGIEVMVEKSPLLARFGDLSVALPPMAFMQPTAQGQTALVQAVMEMLPAKGRFADLFSGCGTFTGPMLERGPVDAYESVDGAVKALDKAKGAKPLKVIRRDLFRKPLTRDEANRYDAIVFDPPRAGAKEQVEAIAKSKAALLIAVSCNPATFARDARILCDGNYRLDSVRMVDQFTWSHHVELVASFVRK